MILLVLASLLWSVSFALIDKSGIDPDLLAAARLGLAALLFLPALWRSDGGAHPAETDSRPRWPAAVRSLRKQKAEGHGPRRLRLVAIGALQFGVMYVLVLRSFQFLKGHEVVLLTITTPLFVVLVESLIERRNSLRPWLGSVVAVVSGAFILSGSEDPGAEGGFWVGFTLVQLSNLAFAAGQVLYRREESRGGFDKVNAAKSAGRFGLLYIGAFLVALPWALIQVEPEALSLTRAQLWSVLYLGIVPSGLAFFLWNLGATKVSVGALAVMNNLKIPLAVLVALLPPFSEEADIQRLLVSSLLLGAALAIVLYRQSTPGRGVANGAAALE